MEWFTQEETINHGSEVADEIPQTMTNAESDTGELPDYTMSDADRKLDLTSIRTWGNI
jgi:hypothetical protein